MEEIICLECKTSVSASSEYCPECGYPFDLAREVQDTVAIDGVDHIQQTTAETTTLDVILQALNSVHLEIEGLQSSVNTIKYDLNSHLITSTDNAQKQLAEISSKIQEIASRNYTKDAESPPFASKKTMAGLLAAFYKTLNSPNSMFEYMFYISVVQIIFVIVNLFLVTYVVTLVR